MSADAGTRAARYRAGLWAEFLGALYLTAKGYRVVRRRYRCPSGEIDLVARRGGVTVFVEVKWRANPEQAGYAITPLSQARIRRAAEHYLARVAAAREHDEIRFDALLITGGFRVQHVRQAW